MGLGVHVFTQPGPEAEVRAVYGGDGLGGEFEYAHVAFEASHGSGLADRRPGRPCPQNRQCRLNENVRAFAGMGAFTF